MRHIVLATAMVCALTGIGNGPGHARADVVIGGFDAARGGGFSLVAGSLLGDVRASIASTFPGATLSGSPSLTAGYLHGLNLLIIAAPTGDNTATAPLSAAEQSALLDYIKAGGGAILLTDNDSYAGSPTSATVNQSFLGQFGLGATGTLNGLQRASVTTTTGPITNGPFTLVTSFTTSFPGFFNNLGPNAKALATLDANNQPALAYIGRGALGPGSGPVVFFSDSSLLIDSVFSTDPGNKAVLMNSIAFALLVVPEPSPVVLLGLGAALVGVVNAWRRLRAGG